MNQKLNAEFDWQRQPEAAKLVAGLLRSLVETIPFASTLAQRMRKETGTRLADWVDHLCLPSSHPSAAMLKECGFVVTGDGDEQICRHVDGMFPTIRIGIDDASRLAIKVESVADFLFAHHIDAPIVGGPMSPLRMAKVCGDRSSELWAVERHGFVGFESPEISSQQIIAALNHAESFARRKRDDESEEDSFGRASDLVRAAIGDIGVDWACDLFFAAERRYWQCRNRAARIQKARQDHLGLGWANHDHHTYRSSREHFTRLVELLEQLGFRCRERFYGGAEAGWGAQVLEQSVAGIVVFADVDLTPDEVTGDFAHEGLTPRDQLGTVGLWCKLHGEAILQAGMHHLECQFDFVAARDQLAAEGVKTMAPFTDMEHLKQAFTEGEVWPVSRQRIDAAVANGFITDVEADRFRQRGSIGSHLEILQRDDGYKGFNQSGISDIIRETDPRHAAVSHTPASRD